MADSSKFISRKIILLSDGTGNAAGKFFKTNVWRLYEALDFSNTTQVAYYDDGVGTSSIKPLALLGGIFGWGLKRNVLNLYTFLCRNYREGDRIYVFGFSRGAFTIRVLVKLILSQGLVANANSNSDLRRKALRLYRRFRIEQTRHWGLHLLARPIRDCAIYLLDRVLRGESQRIETQPVPSVEFLGLWDSVDAYGLPIQELERAVDRWIWPLTIDDSRLHPSVKKACHALSIDDARTTFHPLLWDETHLEADEKGHTDNEVLTQVWFAGVHANIGGGYPDDSLSSVTLQWMINEARKKGIIFARPQLEVLKTRVAPYGPIYNSRAGFGAYYRYGPRRLDQAVDRLGACVRNPKIHETVIWRMVAGTDSYSLLSRPIRLRVVVDEGLSLDDTAPLISSSADAGVRCKNILPFEEFLDVAKSKQIAVDGISSISESMALRRLDASEFQNLKVPDDRSLDIIWDTVWWRRVANYTTLIVTACVIAGFYNLLVHPGDHAAPDWLESQVGFVSAPLVAIANSFLPRIIANSSETLLKSNPASSAMLLALVGVSMWWGRYLDRRIRDRALAAWNVRWHSFRYNAFRTSLRFRYIVATIALIALSLLTTRIGLIWFVHHLLIYDPSHFAVLPEKIQEMFAGNDRTIFQSQESAVRSFTFERGIQFAIFLAFLTAVAIWLLGLHRIAEKGKKHRVEFGGLALWVANRIRTSTWLCAMQRFFQQTVLPAGFAVGIVAGAIVLINPFGFAFLEAGGWVCEWPGNTSRQIPRLSKPLIMELRSDTLCQQAPNSLWLAKGTTYHVQLEMDKKWIGAFHSAPLPALDDLSAEEPRSALDDAFLTVLSLFRRVPTRDWFTPVVQVGLNSNQLYFLPPFGGHVVITPTESSSLYFYVNHAVIGLPFLSSLFYKMNKGTAIIRIEEWPNPAVASPYALANVLHYVLSAAKEQALRAGDSFRECAQDCPEMVVLPAGSFIMGSPASEEGRYATEGPQHTVTVPKPFAVSKYEITFADWDACVKGGGCSGYVPGDSGWGRARQPVINVSWDDAQAYATWLSWVTGKTYRLLSEAEYEYSTRADGTTAYPWGDEIRLNSAATANCNGCGSQWDNKQTAPVGSFSPNKFGLYDMVGNVWEWLEDCYHPSYEIDTPQGKLDAPADSSAWISGGDCGRRIVRGGSFSGIPRTVRSAMRGRLPPDERNGGFRVARTLADGADTPAVAPNIRLAKPDQ